MKRKYLDYVLTIKTPENLIKKIKNITTNNILFWL